MRPDYPATFADIRTGTLNAHMWGRLGWREVKRRYRRTVVGPFWTTLSLAIFIMVLGVVWANLMNQEPKAYLPYLTSGMISWVLLSTIVTEGSMVFIQAESLIKQLQVSYTLLAWAVVWRNLIVFAHNLLIYVVVAIYGGVPVGPVTLLVLPGLALVAINGVWISLLLGLMCARFRDIQQVISSLLQISMFVTPIFWPVDQLKGRMNYVVDYNILYHYVDVVRGPLLGRAPLAWSWGMVIVATIVGWMVTIALFSRFRRRVPYWL